MPSLSSPRASANKRRFSAVPGQAIAHGLAFVRVIAAEFRCAIAAAHRYDQLKRMAGEFDPPASPSRRIYMEFYSDR
jgi:hypothetical protein